MERNVKQKQEASEGYTNYTQKFGIKNGVSATR